MDSINDASKFGGDAWSELQAFKTRQINRREKLNRHKDLINGLASNQIYSPSLLTASSSSNQNPSEDANNTSQRTRNCNKLPSNENDAHTGERHPTGTDHKYDVTNFYIDSQNASLVATNVSTNINHRTLKPEMVECLLLLKLCDVALKLPIDSRSLQRSICKISGLENTSQRTIENLLEKFAHQELITIEEPSTAILNKLRKHHQGLDDDRDDEFCIYVISADHTKLVEFDKTFGSSEHIRSLMLESRTEDSHYEHLTSNNSVPIQSIRTYVNHGWNSNVLGDEFSRGRSSQISGHKTSNGIEPRRTGKEIYSRLDDSKKSLLGDDVESLLSLSSTREKESKKLGEELLELLSKPTAKERNLLESFRSADGYQVQEFCFKGTKDECRRYSKEPDACDKLHFRKIIAKHTEESLGDCSFLNTCFHMDSCKYVHYEVDYNTEQLKKNQADKTQSNRTKARTKQNSHHQLKVASKSEKVATDKLPDSNSISIPDLKCPEKYLLSVEEQARIDLRNQKRFKTVLNPPQWIQCDLRYFDMSLLGKFSVIMADPPWDIHMELPYGTMSDDEMRKLNIPTLQDEGLIFLWVTGRAMELGRECLALWGYERCDEIIWVKTNQLQRIIRTGRTGHWLNHGKEHCLVGIKGNPTDINRGLDCDIIVAEVRATSHKPDEIYGIIERLSPGTRKIELFGRAHNVQPNWVTLGNQLNGVKLVEPDLVENFKRVNLPTQTSDQIA